MTFDGCTERVMLTPLALKPSRQNILPIDARPWKEKNRALHFGRRIRSDVVVCRTNDGVKFGLILLTHRAGVITGVSVGHRIREDDRIFFAISINLIASSV
jgi:hypothetical protein